MTDQKITLTDTEIVSRPVEVQWLDSHMRNGSWYWDYDEQEEIDSMSHTSAGYVLFDNKECITLVQSKSDWSHADGTFNVANTITIPKKCIIQITPFKCLKKK